ncbi:histidine phosphatase family protein [Epibacterium ulvae]|uniref:histidine phosphatase family protein n=1 Tax=Epibacterium ulvae TaxID=1156985 RepID=UPI001BFC0EB3|nr:histidine phosphatase family protein [Epibacterium ulvae]MBT8153455.1 histidine phosphatase family protein [Epibacterium ulvae]
MTDRYVAFIRHGAYHQKPGCPSALQPYPLTDEGMQQAAACGLELADFVQENGWTLDPQVHSSLQLRAWQTAKVALGNLGGLGQGASITQVPDLSERSVGSAANLTLTEIETVLREDPRVDAPPRGWKSDSDYRLPLHGAESLMEAGTRVAQYIQRIMDETETGSNPDLTLFFGHGASFRHAAFKLGLLAREEIPRLSMFHAKPLLFRYSAQGTWSHYAGDWKHRKRSENEVD